MEKEVVDDTANLVLDNPLFVGHESESLSVTYEKTAQEKQQKKLRGNHYFCQAWRLLLSSRFGMRVDETFIHTGSVASQETGCWFSDWRFCGGCGLQAQNIIAILFIILYRVFTSGCLPPPSNSWHKSVTSD